MTTAIGLARNGAVMLAADSMTNVYERPVTGFTKVIRMVVPGVTPTEGPGDGAPVGAGEVLLACSGAGGLIGMARAHLKIDAMPDEVGDHTTEGDWAPWAHAIGEAFTDLAGTNHLFTDGRLDGAGILAAGGRLWTLFHGGALFHADGLAAIGSGGDVALGALDALLAHREDTDTWTDGALLHAALTIAHRRDKHTGGPALFQYIPAPAPAGEPTADQPTTGG